MKRREKKRMKKLIFVSWILTGENYALNGVVSLCTNCTNSKTCKYTLKERAHVVTRTYFSLGSANSSSSAFSSGVGAGCWGWWCFEVILIPPAFTKTKIKQNKIKVRRIIVVCICISLLREKHGWQAKLSIRENNSSLTTCRRVASFQIFIFLFRGWRHGEECKFSAFKITVSWISVKNCFGKVTSWAMKSHEGSSGVCD